MLNEIKKEETMEKFDYDFEAYWSPETKEVEEPKTVFFGRRLWVKQPDGSWEDWDRLQNR